MEEGSVANIRIIDPDTLARSCPIPVALDRGQPCGLAPLVSAAGRPGGQTGTILTRRYLMPDPLRRRRPLSNPSRRAYCPVLHHRRPETLARRLQDAGVVTVMPLGLPRWARGLQTRTSFGNHRAGHGAGRGRRPGACATL